MADDATNTPIDQKTAEKNKAVLDDIKQLLEGVNEQQDYSKSIQRAKVRLYQEERAELRDINDLSASINDKVRQRVQVHKQINTLQGAYTSIQKQIVQSQTNLENSIYRSKLANDVVRQQSILLSQKEKQYKAEIASGKVTERTKFARLRELSVIKQIIATKEKEVAQEEKLQGILKKKFPLLEKEAKIKERQLESNRASLKSLDEEISKEKQILALKSAQYVENQLFGDIDSYKKLKEFGKNVAEGGIGSMLTLLTASLNRWKELDKAAGNFREKTGLLVTQTRQIDEAARNANVKFGHLGVTIDKAYASAQSYTNQLGVAGLVTDDMVTETAKLTENIGISTEDTAKFASLFESTARRAGTTSVHLAKAAAYLSDMGGVAPNVVMRDVAKSAKETLTFLAASPIQLIKTAIEARRMGTDLDSVSRTARGYLNYQTSITKELEASALLGRSISFQESRMLAWQKKPLEARKAALREIAKLGDFSDLDVFQQETVSEASGISIEDIIKAQNQEKMLQTLQSQRPELYKKIIDFQEKISANEKEAQSDAVKQAELWAEQQLRQTETQKINNAMDSAWTNIKDSLLPIANAVMPAVVQGTRLFADGVKIAAGAVKGLFSPLDAVFSKFRSGNKYALDIERAMAKIGKITNAVADNVEGLVSVFSTVALQGGVLLYTIKNIGRAFGGAGTTMRKAFAPFYKLSDIFINLSEKISQFGGSLGKMGELVKPITAPLAKMAKMLGVFSKFAGPIALVANALQFVWEFSSKIIDIWSNDKLNIGEKVLQSLLAIPSALFDVLIAPFIEVGAWILRKFGVDVPEGIAKGIKDKSAELAGLLISPFTKTFDWVKENLMGKSPSKIGLGLLDGIKSVGSSLTSALSSPFKSSFKQISKIFNVGGELMSDFGDETAVAGKALQDNMNEISKSVLESVKSIEKALEKSGENISALASSMVAPLNGLIASAATSVKKKTQEVAQYFKKMETEISSTIKDIKSSINEELKNTRAIKLKITAETSIDGIKTRISEIIDSIKQEAGLLTKSIQDFSKNVFSGFSKIDGKDVSKTFNQISSSIQVLDSAVNKLSLTLNNVQVSMQNLQTAAIAFSSIGDTFKSAIKSIKNEKIKAPESLNDMLVTMVVNIEKIKTDTLEMMGSIAKTLSSNISVANELIYGMVDSAFGYFGKTVKESSVRIYDGVTKSLSGLSEPIYAAVNVITESMQTAFDNIEKSVQVSYKKIAEIATNTFSASGDFGKSMIDGIVDINESMILIFRKTFSTISDVAAFQIQSTVDVLKKTMESAQIQSRDMTMQVGGAVQRRVEEPQTTTIQVENMTELKTVIDKLMSTISRIDAANITPAPVVNVPDTSEPVVKKVQELIDLLREGAIAVNIDGSKASKLLANASY